LNHNYMPSLKMKYSIFFFINLFNKIVKKRVAVIVSSNTIWTFCMTGYISIRTYNFVL